MRYYVAALWIFYSTSIRTQSITVPIDGIPELIVGLQYIISWDSPLPEDCTGALFAYDLTLSLDGVSYNPFSDSRVAYLQGTNQLQQDDYNTSAVFEPQDTITDHFFIIDFMGEWAKHNFTSSLGQYLLYSDNFNVSGSADDASASTSDVGMSTAIATTSALFSLASKSMTETTVTSTSSASSTSSSSVATRGTAPLDLHSIDSSHLHSYAIAGIVIGGILAFVAIAGLAVCVRRFSLSSHLVRQTQDKATGVDSLLLDSAEKTKSRTASEILLGSEGVPSYAEGPEATTSSIPTEIDHEQKTGALGFSPIVQVHAKQPERSKFELS